jgi:hypothetical protein
MHQIPAGFARAPAPETLGIARLSPGTRWTPFYRSVTISRGSTTSPTSTVIGSANLSRSCGLVVTIVPSLAPRPNSSQHAVSPCPMLSGKNHDHRKVWIEQDLQRLAASFGIDLPGFALLSNHFHLILRSRPDVVATWDDAEVARRWLMLCPVRKDPDGVADEPNEAELNFIRNDPHTLATIRLRLRSSAFSTR